MFLQDKEGEDSRTFLLRREKKGGGGIAYLHQLERAGHSPQSYREDIIPSLSSYSREESINYPLNYLFLSCLSRG